MPGDIAPHPQSAVWRLIGDSAEDEDVLVIQLVASGLCRLAEDVGMEQGRVDAGPPGFDADSTPLASVRYPYPAALQRALNWSGPSFVDSLPHAAPGVGVVTSCS